MAACLSCHEAANLGDVALALQKTALEAEQCIYAQELLLQEAVNRPTIVVQTTATININAGDQQSITGSGSPTTLFDNTGSSNPDLQLLDGGIWMIGATINVAASGVVNNNTVRRLTAAKVNYSNFTIAESVANSTTETSATGGIDMTVSGIFATVPGQHRAQIYFYHQNTSSTMTIAVGAILWATRLGDSFAVKVV